MTKLADKDFQTAIINMLNDLEEITNIMEREIKDIYIKKRTKWKFQR